MTIQDWLKLAQTTLHDSGITTARLDALILLEDATHHDRAWLLAHLEAELTTIQLERLADNLERRLQHEPLAYIRGHAAFYGRDFIVDEHVLVPRPESEAMIDILKTLKPDGLVADIGTGSGALAVTAALETNAVVCAVDIDEACLAVANENAVRYTASVQFLQGNLLQPFSLQQVPDVLLCNLPYVPANYLINEAAKYEPALALFAGDDGLDCYRQLFSQILGLPSRSGYVLTEALPEQHEALVNIAAMHDYTLQTTTGLVQLFQAA